MIAQSLQEFVGGFDFQRAAEQHLRYRRHTEVRHPDGRVETTVEIVESALGAFRRLESGLPRAGEWAALRSPLEQATLALHPSTWPTVLVDVGSPQNVTRWLEAGPDGSGLGFSDNEPRFADIFRVFSDFRPGLTLARFGLVAVRVPPVLDLLGWLDNSQLGVDGLYLGDEQVGLPPEPHEFELGDDEWDGHDLVMNRRTGRDGRAKYPGW